MLPIRSIVLALCATVVIAAPLSGSVCPTDGDCPTCFGRQTPDLHDIVCNSDSAFIVVTGVDTDGKKWSSPRRWQDIFGAHGSRYAIEHFPFDERHWNEQPESTCRTYYAKPAYEITSGQAPRRVETPDVAAFKLNSKCSCIGLIHEAGYAVVAFRNRTVAGSDELATQPLNKDVIVVPLPRGEFKIPSCNAKFTEDKSAISTEKLPAVFANDETQLECDKVTSCPKCEYLQRPDQLKDICQSSKELMIVKQSLSREEVDSPKAPWHMPKIEVYVDKDSTQQNSYEIRTKITSRGEKGCIKPNLRLLTGLTENLNGVSMLRDMQLGQECQCDFLRHEHGFAMIRSERELHKSDVLSDKETIIVLPRGQYVLPQCPREDEIQRSDNDDDEKAQCEKPEETCPVCEESVSEMELYKGIQSGEAIVVKMQTNSQLKKSEEADDVRCGSAEVITVLKGEKENVKSELSFTLPERCRCGAMAGYGRQFYAVVKKEAVEGDRLEKLPLNEKVFIVGHNYRSNNLVQRWLNPDSVDDAEDRSSYDGYASYAPSYGYSAPSYGYSTPSYPAPSYGYSAPSYSAPSYGYSAPSYGYSAPSYSAPSYGYSAPSYSAPSYGYSAPSYSAPSYGYSAPSYSAPSYGYSAPSYSAPSYGYSAPSYPAPSYGYSAPSYSAPSYGYSAPSYSAPSYGYSAPSYSAPSYGYSAPVSYAPMYSSSYSYMQPSYGMDYSAPSYGYSAPSYSAPSYGYSAPSYSAPSYSAPSYDYSAPSYSAPSYGYSAPSYGYSAPSYGYSAPSYSAPSYGYSAPSYSAPSYGYSAPSYSAPSYGYSAPSYSAPSYGYSAPSYSAPSYGYSAPSYSAPSYGYSAPSYSSDYSAPSYSAPSYSAPSYGYSAPSYSAPSYGYSAPSYSAPSYGYSAPSYSAPSYGYSAPSYSAPSYGYSAPSYPAPSYGYSAPSYSAPSYGYSAPSYSAPSYDSYSAPSYSAPSYSAPSYSAPSYSAPSYSAPSYSAPSYSAPSYSAPSYDSYSAPSYSAPSYSAPSYSAPSYSAPSYGYSAPSYSAPSYGYSAPSYSAPSYSAPSYSAPSYSAPSYGYSAPSYSAPSYSAPSYSAPSYSAPSYSAPSYGYSAPSYSAPSYSAPSYSAPSYSAPSYGYSAPSYPAPSYGGSYDTPQIAVSYSMPVTIPIVTAKSTYSKGYGYGKGGYGNDYGKTSGTQIVETTVEATYTTVVGIQSADAYPSTGPTYQPGYQQAPGYSYQK